MTQARRRELLREYSQIEAQVYALRKRQEELELLIFGHEPTAKNPHNKGAMRKDTLAGKLLSAARKLGKEFRAVDVAPGNHQKAAVELALLVHKGKVVRVSRGLFRLAA